MTNITIARETFQADGPERVFAGANYEMRFQPGTVTVTMGNQSVTAKAERDERGSIWVRGFIGRYRTSPKPWRATVSLSTSDHLYVNFGRDDRSGRFNKMNAISWEPDTYDAI